MEPWKWQLFYLVSYMPRRDCKLMRSCLLCQNYYHCCNVSKPCVIQSCQKLNASFRSIRPRPIGVSSWSEETMRLHMMRVDKRTANGIPSVTELCTMTVDYDHYVFVLASWERPVAISFPSSRQRVETLTGYRIWRWCWHMCSFPSNNH